MKNQLPESDLEVCKLFKVGDDDGILASQKSVANGLRLAFQAGFDAALNTILENQEDWQCVSCKRMHPPQYNSCMACNRKKPESTK